MDGPKDALSVDVEVLRSDGGTRRTEATDKADFQVRTERFDVLRYLHQARRTLAVGLLGLLVGVVAMGALLLGTTRWTGVDPRDASDFVTMVFTAVMTLTGSAVGFYFGGERR